MLGETITILIGGTGGVSKTLNRINQDGYSAEYYLRESLQEFRMKVSHTKAKNADRHFVEIKQIIFPVGTTTPEIVRTASLVMNVKSNDDAALAVDLYEGLTTYITGAIAVRLLGWES